MEPNQQTSKQNTIRYIEIKNKLTVTRGERDNRGKKGKGHQGTCIKDPWTKPKWGRMENGGWGRGKLWWENGDNCNQKIIEMIKKKRRGRDESKNTYE